MIKKSLIAVVVVGAVAMAIPSTRYHVLEVCSWASNEIEQSIPIEAQLADAESTVADLAPEILDDRRRVASEEVEISDLLENIRRNEASLDRDALVLKARSQALKGGDLTLAVAGRPYSRPALAQSLRYALESHKRGAALLSGQKQTLEVRQRRLDALRDGLNAKMAKKETLALKIEELRAFLRENEALEAVQGTAHIEDTRISEVTESLKNIDKRLRVQRKMIEGANVVLGGVDDIAVDPAEVAASVDAYFGSKAESEEVLSPVSDKR